MLRYLFSFHGRASRFDFWANTLVHVVSLLFAVIWVSVFDSPPSWETGTLAGTYFSLPLPVIAAWFLSIWTSLAVVVRRLHDRDKSGMWLVVFWGPSAVATFLLETGYAPSDLTAIGMLILVVGIWYYVELGLRPGVEGARDFEWREVRATTELPPVVVRLERRSADGFGRRSV